MTMASILGQKIDRHLKANEEFMNLVRNELKSCRTSLGQSAAKSLGNAKKLSTMALKKPEAVTVVSNLSQNQKVSPPINSTAVVKCDRRAKVCNNHHQWTLPKIIIMNRHILWTEKYASSSKRRRAYVSNWRHFILLFWSWISFDCDDNQD